MTAWHWIADNGGFLLALAVTLSAIVGNYFMTRYRIEQLEASRSEFRRDVAARMERVETLIDQEVDNVLRRIELVDREGSGKRSEIFQRLSVIETRSDDLRRRVDVLEGRAR